jgi:hypothetical protein
LTRAELTDLVKDNLRCTGWNEGHQAMMFEYQPHGVRHPALDVIVKAGLDRESYVGLLQELLERPRS